MTNSTTPDVTLYGAPMSMYSGKVRAYLRKHCIAFQEVMPGDLRFREKIYPQVKRGIVPVLEHADGQLVQDTVDIIDHFENHNLGKFSVYPCEPKQRLAALILDLFGSEGLFKVAMHYRWNYLDVNEDFIRYEFGDHAVPGAKPDMVAHVAEKVMGPMQAYLPLLGINSDTIPAIEAQYLELLSLLNAHFSEHPYLLGGLPSVADYGFFAPLYAHLSRDPHPGMLMKQSAQRVYRWTERMNAANADTHEYGNYEAAYFPDDEIPSSLHAILALIGRDYMPEIRQTLSSIDTWLAQNPQVEAGSCVTAKPRIKSLMPMDYSFRGVTMTGMVMPYRLYMLQRITDTFAELPADVQKELTEFFDSLGLAELLTMKAQRRVERAGHIEVWGESVGNS